VPAPIASARSVSIVISIIERGGVGGSGLTHATTDPTRTRAVTERATE
jgi:hypothetical protein